MKNKFLLVSLSVTFVVAMYATNHKTNAEQISEQYAINSISHGGGGGEKKNNLF